MGDISGQITAARKAGYSDDDIVKFLGNDQVYGPAFHAASAHGYAPKEILDHFQPTDGDTPDPATLKPNDELGFLNGGAKVFNNMLGAGSSALQAVGVSPTVVHAVGGMIRHGPVGAFTGAHLPNRDELAGLDAQAAQQGQRPGQLGNVAGQAVAALPAAVASAGLAPEALGVNATSRFAPVLNALAGRGLGGAAVQGAEQGLETANKGDNLLLDAAGGAGAGALGHQVLGTLGAAVAPRFNASMNALIRLGQNRFTIGQLSGNPAIQTVEDAARSIPLAGAAIEDAQHASQQDFQRAYLQNVSDQGRLGVRVPARPGHETYQDLQQGFNTQYRQAYGQARVNSTPALQNNQNAGAVLANTVHEANPALATRIDGLFHPVYDPATQTWAHGSLSGTDLQETHQILDAAQKHLMNPGVGVGVAPSARAQAQAIGQAQDTLRAELATQQPQVAQRLNDLNTNYAKLMRAQEAVTSPAGVAEPGNFTPKGLLNKTMAAAGSNNRASMGAAGTVPGQDIAEAANQVMKNRIGDSGTPLRTALQRITEGGINRDSGAAIGAAGAAGMFHSPAVVPALASAGAIAAPYLPGVRDLISRTLVGNSRNRLLVGARAAFDRPTLNALAHLGINVEANSKGPDTPQ